MVIKMKKLIRKYRNEKLYDLSCSETMIYAANEKYDLGLTETHYNMLAPFSGGMYEGETCGVVTGAIAVLGIIYTDGVSHNSPVLKEAVVEYKTRFKELLGSQVCNTLIDSQRDEITGCDSIIIQGGNLLEEVIKKYGKLHV